MTEQAKSVLDQAIEVFGQATGAKSAGSLEVVAGPKPVEAMTASELLSETAMLGLRRLREIVSLPLDRDDPKQMRLIGDMSLGSIKVFQRAAEASLQAKQQDRIGEILERLAQAGREPIDG